MGINLKTDIVVPFERGEAIICMDEKHIFFLEFIEYIDDKSMLASDGIITYRLPRSTGRHLHKPLLTIKQRYLVKKLLAKEIKNAN